MTTPSNVAVLMAQHLALYTEALLCAYMEETGLQPNQLVMMQMCGDKGCAIWYVPAKERRTFRAWFRDLWLSTDPELREHRVRLAREFSEVCPVPASEASVVGAMTVGPASGRLAPVVGFGPLGAVKPGVATRLVAL